MMNDIRKKAATLAALSEMFAKPLSESAAEMYLDAVADLTDAQFSAAAMRCIQNGKWFPTVSEIRAHAGKAQVSREDKAIRAWTEAWNAVSEHGAYVSVQFGDAVTAKTIQTMGGWPQFCRPDNDEQWHRKEFLDTYRAMLGEVPEGESALRLQGVHERGGGTIRVVLVGTQPAVPQLESKGKSDASVMREVQQRATMSEATR